jgi:predicted lysophospholipase L1 biosynthesis ABC-type transport system permease subunit
VGIAVVPTIGGIDGIGHGGLVTADGLKRVERKPTSSLAAIVLRPEATAEARKRIARQINHTPDAGLQDRPGVIVNLARVRRIPGFLAALLAALLLLTMFHAVVTSIQSRRRDVAVLRAIGADRRWIGRAVHWQASVLTAMPLVFGVPLGLIAGSVVFRAFVGRIGAVPDPAIPIVLVIAMAIGLVVLANVVAVVPARRARRLSTAELLKAE